ncbi:MAG: hypothetical protein WCA20_10545 [Candidatus Sulfotelmatobacter sp.]
MAKHRTLFVEFRPDGFRDGGTVETPNRQGREQRKSCGRMRFEKAHKGGDQKAQRSQKGY